MMLHFVSFAIHVAAISISANAAYIPTRPTLHVFGDSMSDNGLLKNLTQGMLPRWPYWEGRYSSGPVWNEYLAPLLGYELNNMAIAGSVPDDDYFNLPGNTAVDSESKTNATSFPTYFTVEGQITAFSTSLPGHVLPPANRNDMVALQTGAAGFLFKSPSIVANEITVNALVDYLTRSTIAQLDQLYRIGFRNIIHVDMPDFQYCPGAALYNTHDLFRTAVSTYNEQVAAMVNAWAAEKHDLQVFGNAEFGKFVHVSINSQAIKSALGITDTTTSCVDKSYIAFLTENPTVDLDHLPLNVADSLLCQSPSTNYFFDYFHVGERVHRLAGYYMSEYVKALRVGNTFTLDEDTLLGLIKQYKLGTDAPKPVKV